MGRTTSPPRAHQHISRSCLSPAVGSFKLLCSQLPEHLGPSNAAYRRRRLPNKVDQYEPSPAGSYRVLVIHTLWMLRSPWDPVRLVDPKATISRTFRTQLGLRYMHSQSDAGRRPVFERRWEIQAHHWIELCAVSSDLPPTLPVGSSSIDGTLCYLIDCCQHTMIICMLMSS